MTTIVVLKKFGQGGMIYWISLFCIKDDDAMWVCMFQRTKKRRQGKKSKLTIMWSIQFDSNNTLAVMNFQNTLKFIRKNHIVRHTIKTFEKKKKETKKHPIFHPQKTPSCREMNEFIMNVSFGHHLHVYIFI